MTSKNYFLFSATLALGLSACQQSGPATVSEAPSPTPAPITNTPSPAGEALVIKVLSNRADILSGGDALIEIVLPAGANGAGLSIDVDGRDVSAQIQPRANGRIMGLVTDLALGDNLLTAKLGDGSGAQIVLSNHPIGGPVFSGPQIQPWACSAGGSDEQCNRTPTYNYHYMSSAGGGFQAYDPANPPADVGTTTTDNGATVPFIVREEIGVIDRDEYRIAVLFDPSQSFEPWAPQPGYTGKLVIFHGASCDTAYEMAAASDVLSAAALGRGFIAMSHALNNAGHNCNIATQAESMIMTKEYLIERYGELRYTIGSGCSGGALAQQQVANAYPGFFQGITPACSFTDAWSSAQQYIDYVMLRNYFENPTSWGLGVVWDPLAIQAVEGHPNLVNAVTFTTAIPNSGDPSRSCPGVPADQVFDENSNPNGVRCSLQDYMVNLFGRREADGYAQRPFDNTGIQYGLKGLIAGTVSAAQFVDINSKLQVLDINGNFTSGRMEADRPALGYLYRTGAINTGSNLDQVAIIDLRGPDPGAFHDVYRTYVMRARLERNFGNANNQILWRGSVPLLGDANYADDSIFAMDRWIGAYSADLSNISLAEKIIKNLPADLLPRCTNGAGVDLPAEICDATVAAYSSPRIEAGMPVTDDVMKCELKPLIREEYLPITFTDEQWANLQVSFPTGVCDYSKPAVDYSPTVPWLTYKNGPGGQPLGEPPASTPLGASKSGKFGGSLGWCSGLLFGAALFRNRRRLSTLTGRHH